MNIREGTDKTAETAEKFGEQLSRGEQIQKEGEETDRIASGIDTSGLDSETISAARDVINTLSETYDSHISEVEKGVEQTAETARDNISSLEDTRKQVDSNAEKYSEMAGVSELSRGAAESGRAKMESDSRQYGDLIQENEKQMDQARERAGNMASAIRGLFKR